VAGGNILIDDGYRQGENEGRYRFNMNLRWRTPRKDYLRVLISIYRRFGALFFIWKNDTTGAYIPRITPSANTRTINTASILPCLSQQEWRVA
jgi:hypothetical protein